jgi:hypothetical protein
MTVVKPKANHPWKSAIKNHVTEANIRKRISELEAHIKALRTEIKMNERKLTELAEESK